MFSLFKKQESPKTAKSETSSTISNFIDQKIEDWPTASSTKKQIDAGLPETKPNQNSQNSSPYKWNRQAQKIPRAAFICRCHLLCWDYLDAQDGYTYFYPRYHTHVMGYKRITEYPPQYLQKALQRKMPLIRVKTEIAQRQLEECRRNGTYEKQWNWSKKPIS